MSEEPKYCAVIVDNRLTNKLYDTILAHRNMLPEWWSCCHIDDPSIKTASDYNRLLTSRKFWERFESFERVLVFQWDSMLLRKGIEEFLEWDYVGAPWTFQEHGGNGGLSLRNPKTMLEIIDKDKYNGYPNEDVWFCNMMLKHGMNLAPREVCKKFSVEAIYELNTLGFHAINRYLNESQCYQIINQYAGNMETYPQL